MRTAAFRTAIWTWLKDLRRDVTRNRVRRFGQACVLAAELPEEARSEVIRRTTLGLHHEQQHQELLITDLKYNFGHNPLAPVYSAPLSGLAATPDAEDGGLGFTSDVCSVTRRISWRRKLDPPRFPTVLTQIKHR